jgi:glycogen operon protein
MDPTPSPHAAPSSPAPSPHAPSSRERLRIRPGKPYPRGATWDGIGVNFALHSAHAERVELVLFDHPDDEAPAETLELPEHTGPIWHGYVANLRPGQLYGYRVYGPYDPANGHRFNPNKVLLDPYAKAIGRPLRWDDSLFGYDVEADDDPDLTRDPCDSAPYAPLGAVVEETFAWGPDQSPEISWEDTLIYETHVKGVTQKHPDVPEPHRGTYLGLAAEPVIEHLKALGVTTVQLLPVHAKMHRRELLRKGLRNYWGYNSLSYFAPEPEYAANGPQSAVRDFKMMVRALHNAGLEVIIDVVYNHTCEGHQMGPTLSWRGIDNRTYYKLNPDDERYYMDYTGTGNTLDPGDSYVLQMVMDSLRYWVTEMHVDGFRFDLASALARELYDVNMLGSFFKVVQQDPILSQVKLIAEPWDVGPGGYQVGSFPWQWAEWNGRYRDAIRRFWRGDRGLNGEVATRIAGSSDLYERSGRRPFASVNFVTAHDGFTLQDLVSYTKKHNEENKEGNEDGHDHSYSTNAGMEGPTEDPEVIRQRERRKRSIMATLLLSQGVPMILGGDELSHTRRGNNNPYCQDNEVTWYDWDLNEREEKFLAFVQRLTQFRNEHPSFRRRHFLDPAGQSEGAGDVLWWHPAGREMTHDDWHDEDLRAFGYLLRGMNLAPDAKGQPRPDDSFLVLMNQGESPVEFALPTKTNELDDKSCTAWHVVPEVAGDLEGTGPFEPGSVFALQPHRLVAFRAERE